VRKTIANALVKNGVQNFVVVDLLQKTFGKTTEEIKESLIKVSATDGEQYIPK
jgi:hypothetical protein